MTSSDTPIEDGGGKMKTLIFEVSEILFHRAPAPTNKSFSELIRGCVKATGTNGK